jgi:transmembrane protein 18
MHQVVITTRKHVFVQGCLFLAMCAAGRAAEYLNSWAANNWRSFATQNYFDPRGIFAAVMFAGPIILILVIQVVSRAVGLSISELTKVARIVAGSHDQNRRKHASCR